MKEKVKKVYDNIKNDEFSEAKSTLINVIGSAINKELTDRGFNKVKIAVEEPKTLSLNKRDIRKWLKNDMV